MRIIRPALWRRRHSSGVALVIALAFVVLLTGLIVAFFSRAMSERQVSNSSASLTKAAQLADGAVAQVISDLKQEIVVGSTGTSIPAGTTTATIYLPRTPATMLPAIAGLGNNCPPNLLKISGSFPFFPGTLAYSGSTGPNRGTGVASTGTSLNGRSISLARWNTSLLLPKASGTTDADLTPMTSGSSVFVAPNWVLVARDGSNPQTWNSKLVTSSTSSSSVVGRYAYAIYNEGGLLDVNTVGYPSVSGSERAYRPTSAYADLKQIPGIGVSDPIVTSIGALSSTQQTHLIDNLVGWRNHASATASGSMGSLSTTGYTFVSGSSYFTSVISSTTGNLQVTGSMSSDGQSDRMFTSRQELIRFVLSGIGSGASSTDRAKLQNSLQYLTHFSRDLNQPAFIPAVQTSATAPLVLDPALGGNNGYGSDKLINPSFPNIRVLGSFTRNNGSTAKVGEPLVKQRFALNRLAWVTYAGPISSGTRYNSAVSSTVIDSLKAQGLTDDFLLQGTATNIRNYFGLNWDSPNNRWTYDAHNGGNTSNSGGSGSIMRIGRSDPSVTANPKVYVQDLYQISGTSGREPDFFELLKAGIAVGSLGKATATSGSAVPKANTPNGYAYSEVPANVRYNLDSSVDYHIIQIGANILSAVNPTSYPVRISFDDGSRGPWEFQGVTDLPYLSYVFNGAIRNQMPVPAIVNNFVGGSPFQYYAATTGNVTSPGKAYVVQVPALWNPYDPNGTTAVLRPSKFRVMVDSNDPITLANGGANHAIWCAGVASYLTAGGNTSNEGLIQPGATVYSWQGTGVGYTDNLGSPLSDSVTFNDGNGTLFREPTLIFDPSVGNATRTGTLGNFTSLDGNPLPGQSGGSTGPWAPLVIGQFPLAFDCNTKTLNGSVNTTANPVMFSGAAAIGPANITNDNRVYFTYRVQYEYPANSGKWVTYDTKYGRTTHGLVSYHSRTNFSPCVVKGPDRFNPFCWASVIDPRSNRFGFVMETVNYGRSALYSCASPPDNTNCWIGDSTGSVTNGNGRITYPIRPDNYAGFYFANHDGNNVPPGAPNGDKGFGLLLNLASTLDIPYPSFSAGWTSPVVNINEGHGNSVVAMFAPGLYTQNNPSTPYYMGRYTGSGDTIPPGGPNAQLVQPSYYADADGVVRRAAGAYVPLAPGSGISASSPLGQTAGCIQGFVTENTSVQKTPALNGSTFSQSQSRPLLLHRPFRSVAELSYVFRDLPWKNLDFFTPESADAGLLDLFCLNESSDPNALVAGKVNLNTRQSPVLAAIISGACVDDPKITNTTVGSVSSTLASTVSQALVARVSDTNNYGPLQNPSELVGKYYYNPNAACSGSVTYSPIVLGANCGVDLPLTVSGSTAYKDGKLSFTGFSGAVAVSAGTSVNLTDAYTRDTTLSGNLSLQTSMAQVQRFREAPIRALGSVGQTRVWNLLIDVIAQTGRYPGSAGALDKFIVEGEQRYWVHLAIDRFTGLVLDKQVEVVKE